jgi:hypothetical protein
MSTSIGKEYSLANLRLALTTDQLAAATYTAIENANIAPYLRRKMKRKVDIYMTESLSGKEISTTALDYKRATTKIPF